MRKLRQRAFPEDLIFQQTADRENFQGRYVLQHAWQGRNQCPALKEYHRQVRERQQNEAETLASLTGWEIEKIREIAERGIDVAVGVIDVKSYYVESPSDVAKRVRLCLKHAPAERLSFAPDCGLSQTARWAARQKLANMVSGVAIVRKELGLA